MADDLEDTGPAGSNPNASLSQPNFPDSDGGSSGGGGGGGGGDDGGDSDRRRRRQNRGLFGTVTDRVSGAIDSATDAVTGSDGSDGVLDEAADLVTGGSSDAGSEPASEDQSQDAGGMGQSQESPSSGTEDATDGSAEADQDAIDESLAERGGAAAEGINDPTVPDEQEPGQRATGPGQKADVGPYPDQGPAGSNPNVPVGQVNLPDVNGSGDLTDEAADGTLTRSEVKAETEDVEYRQATTPEGIRRQERLQGPLGSDPNRQDEPGVELTSGRTGVAARQVEEAVISQSDAVDSQQQVRVVRENGRLVPELTTAGETAIASEFAAGTPLESEDVGVTRQGEIELSRAERRVLEADRAVEATEDVGFDERTAALPAATQQAVAEVQLQEAQEDAASQATQRIENRFGPSFERGEDFTVNTTVEDGRVSANAELTDEGRVSLARERFAEESDLEPGEDFQVSVDERTVVDENIEAVAERAPTGVDHMVRAFATPENDVDIDLTEQGRIELAGQAETGQTQVDRGLEEFESATGIDIAPGEGDVVQDIEADLQQAAVEQRAGRGLVPSDEEISDFTGQFSDISAPGVGAGGGVAPDTTETVGQFVNINPAGTALSAGRLGEGAGESFTDIALSSPLGAGAFVGDEGRQSAEVRVGEDIEATQEFAGRTAAQVSETVTERPGEAVTLAITTGAAEIGGGLAAGAGLRRGARATRGVRDRVRTAGSTDITDAVVSDDVQRFFDPDATGGERFPATDAPEIVRAGDPAEAVRQQSADMTPDVVQERFALAGVEGVDLKKALDTEPAGPGSGRSAQGLEAPEAQSDLAAAFETAGTSFGPEVSPNFLRLRDQADAQLSFRPGLPTVGRNNPTVVIARTDVENPAARTTQAFDEELRNQAGDTTALAVRQGFEGFDPVQEAEAQVPPDAEFADLGGSTRRNLARRLGIGSDFRIEVGGRRIPVRAVADPDQITTQSTRSITDLFDERGQVSGGLDVDLRPSRRTIDEFGDRADPVDRPLPPASDGVGSGASPAEAPSLSTVEDVSDAASQPGQSQLDGESRTSGAPASDGSGAVSDGVDSGVDFVDDVGGSAGGSGVEAGSGGGSGAVVETDLGESGPIGDSEPVVEEVDPGGGSGAPAGGGSAGSPVFDDSPDRVRGPDLPGADDELDQVGDTAQIDPAEKEINRNVASPGEVLEDNIDFDDGVDFDDDLDDDFDFGGGGASGPDFDAGPDADGAIDVAVDDIDVELDI